MASSYRGDAARGSRGGRVRSLRGDVARNSGLDAALCFQGVGRHRRALIWDVGIGRVGVTILLGCFTLNATSGALRGFLR